MCRARQYRAKRDCQSLPPHVNAKAHARIMEFLRTATKEEFVASLVHAGICNADGTLTEHYRSTEPAAAIPSTEDEHLKWMRRHRGVVTPCVKCNGFGVRHYGSAATWRGGMACACMQRDVCDHCWGTGDEHVTGVDLRVQINGEDQRVNERAVELIALAACCPFESCKPTVLEVADELDRLARGRKARPRWFDAICTSLAATLRKGCKASDAQEAAQ